MYELKTENLCIEFIINPCYHTTVHGIQSFVSANCDYKFLLHAGPVFQETGNWILQDGTLSHSTFSSLFHGSDTGCIELAVSHFGDWNVNNLSGFADESIVQNLCPECSENAANQFKSFAEEVSHQLELGTVMDSLMATDVVGNMSFTKPTIYIFPGGQGSSSLFCINGFNILVDGGFGRRCCFWSLVRHFEGIDAVLLTSLSEENILGVAAFLERKVLEDLHPRIGAVFVNSHCTPKNEASFVKVPESGEELCVSLVEESSAVMERLWKLDIQPRCFVSSHGSNWINLFHLIGYGSLDMYVLSPLDVSKEWKEYVDQKSALRATSNQISACAVIVFQPAAPATCPTRVLFCGSCTQSEIFSGCDRLKMLHLFQTVSGLPEERSVRPSSVSMPEKSSDVPVSKPRVTSVSSAFSSSRALQAKKLTVAPVKEPTFSVMSSGELASTKTVSRRLPKPSHHVEASKKPVKKPPQGDKGAKPQPFAKEIRHPVTAKDGSRSSHDILKGSTSAGVLRGSSAKPPASKSEAAVGTKPVMSTKGKKPDTSGRPKMLAKHDNEPQATISKTAAKKPETFGDKTDKDVEEMMAAVAECIIDAEFNTDEHYMEAGAAIHQQQSKVLVESADSELPTDVDRQLDSYAKHKPFDANAAVELAELAGVSFEVSAKLLTESDAAFPVAGISVKHEPYDASTTAEQAELDAASNEVSVSKREPEVDVDEKDVDTVEAERDSLAGEVISRVGEDRHDEKSDADEEVLLLVGDPLVESADSELPADVDTQLEISTIHKPFDVTTAVELAELGGVSSEVSAKLLTESDAAFPVAGISVKHEPYDASTTVEQAELDATSIEVSVSKREQEVDVDEKDVDTVEAELDGLAGEVISRVGDDRHHEKFAADEEVLPLLDDPVVDVDNVEENAGDGVTNRVGAEQFFADDIAEYANPDQPDKTELNHNVGGPNVGPGSGNAESTFAKVNSDEYLKHCANEDESHHSEASKVRDTESAVCSVRSGDDAVKQQSITETVEFDMKRTPLVDEDNSTETQQDVVVDMDVGVQYSNESEVQSTEELTPALATDNSEMQEDNANSDGKPSEEISQDNAVGKGCDMFDEEKSATDDIQDGCSESKVLEDNAGGEVSSADGISEFEWEAPQPLPSPVKDKYEKSAPGTNPSSAAAAKKPAGSFKVPAPKPKKAVTHRDDLNVSDGVTSSRSSDSRTSGRLSLQSGDLKRLSPMGQRKTSMKPVFPFYVDLVSLPVSATGTCTVDVDFFRRIRAQYYVINSSMPDSRALEHLAEAKATWEDQTRAVTLIPTGSPTFLLDWFSDHREQMTALQISVSASASQCVVELQGSSCSAYRLEF